MAVLLNNNTGLVEDLPQQPAADAALAQGTHSIPLIGPEGDIRGAALGDVPTLLQQGHTEPTAEQLGHLLHEAKYSTPEEQAKTAIEGGLEQATFGASARGEDYLFHNKQNQQFREEVNPGLKDLGRAGSLATQMMLGIGEAEMAAQAGKGIANGIMGIEKSLPLSSFVGAEAVQPSLVSRLTHSAIKGATEMAILQSGDEVAKTFLDPNHSMEDVAADIGMAAAFGGAFGTVARGASDLWWDRVQAPKLEKVLSVIKGRVEGAEAAKVMAEASRAAGIELSPELRAAMSGENRAKEMFQQLEASGSKAGDQVRAQKEQALKSAQDSVLNTLGKSAEDVGAKSDFEAGQEIKDSLQKSLKAEIEPLSKDFESIKEKFKTVPIEDGTQLKIKDGLGKLATEGGYALSESSPALKEINRVIEDLPNLKTLEDVRKYQGIVRSNTANVDPYLGRQIVGVLRDAEEELVSSRLAKEAPELAERHQLSRQSYKELMGKIDDLNDRLHVGKYWGPDSFLGALKEMSPEDVLRRMRGTNDAGLLSMLERNHPEVADLVRGHHVDQLLKKAMLGQKEGELNLKTFFKGLDKMPNELRQFAISPAKEQMLGEVRKIVEALPQKVNPSGTFQALDKAGKWASGGIGSLISMMFGHGPVSGYLLGHVGRIVGREAPDAVRLAMLKALGSSEAIDAKAFKNVVNMADSLKKASVKAEKAAKGVFEAGAKATITPPIKPGAIEKLANYVKVAQTDQEDVSGRNDGLAHYLPDHAVASAALTTRASSYLNSLRPSENSAGILDKPRTPSPIEKAKYDRALRLVESPISVLQHVKDGTLTPQDLQTMNTVFPALTKKLQSQVFEKLVDAHSSGTPIPYKTRMAVSMFLGETLDSSLSPQSIMANQAAMAPQQPQPQPGTAKPSQAGMKNLSKISAQSQTPQQAREQARVIRK